MAKKTGSGLSRQKIDAIRANIFEGAHGAITDWSRFSWHRTKTGVDTDVPHSSQGLCISIWGTFVSAPGAEVRRLVAEQLDDAAFTRAVRAGQLLRPMPEYVAPDLLGERGRGNPSNLDFVLPFADLAVIVESKLSEHLGACRQVTKKLCSGVYGPESDHKASTMHLGANCRLDVPDGRRTPRLYWPVMRLISRVDAYSIGAACPFAGSEYQVMRNIASAKRYAEVQKVPDWRVVFAYPFDAHVEDQTAIKAIRDLLIPEHASRVLELDYRELGARLKDSSDPVARALGLHIMKRLEAACPR